VNAAPLGAGIRPKLVPREWSDYSGALCAEQRNRRDRKKWGEVPTWCGARFGCGGPLGFGWGGRVEGGIAKRGDRRREMAGDVVVE
jgi:hypothetical protein